MNFDAIKQTTRNMPTFVKLVLVVYLYAAAWLGYSALLPLTKSPLTTKIAACSHLPEFRRAKGIDDYNVALGSLAMTPGNDHPNYVEFLFGFAMLRNDQATYYSAEMLFQKTLDMILEQEGDTSLATTKVLNTLGKFYAARGQEAQAHHCFDAATLIADAASIGPDPDPFLSIYKYEAAQFYRAQGQLDTAERLLLEAVEIDATSDVDPVFHGNALHLSALAALYKAQGKYALAEPHALRAVVISKETPAPLTRPVHSVEALADLYQAWGKYALAEQQFKAVIAAHTDELGADHPQTFSAMVDLAQLYQAWGKFEQGEPLLLSALDSSANRDGTLTRFRSAIRLHQLSQFYAAWGNADQAETLWQQALQIVRTFKPDGGRYSSYDERYLKQHFADHL